MAFGHFRRLSKGYAAVTATAAAAICFTSYNTKRCYLDSPSTATSNITFKDAAIGNYENRIRFYAHPLKTFQYFSNLPDGMNSKDFVRSLIPFNQGLLLTQTVDDNPILLDAYQHITKMADTDGNGLISYDEYLLMLSLLSIKKDLFEVTFKIYDSDGNGTLDYSEFSQDSCNNVATSRMGTREKPSNVGRAQLSGVLSNLFGPDGKLTCTFKQFSSLISELRSDLLKCEFYRFASLKSYSSPKVFHKEDSISAFDFGCAILSYVSLNQSSIQQRLEDNYKNSPVRVTFQDFHDFDHLTENLDKLALGMEIIARVNKRFRETDGLNREEFRKVVNKTTGVNLKPEVVEILFCMFDENGDKQLAHSEFLGTVKSRDSWGQDKIESGIIGKVKRIINIIFE